MDLVVFGVALWGFGVALGSVWGLVVDVKGFGGDLVAFEWLWRGLEALCLRWGHWGGRGAMWGGFGVAFRAAPGV